VDALYKKYPTHPGVVHYFLHTHDANDQKLAQDSLNAAKTALTIMRSSPHVAHMSAHIYRRLERWDDFIFANQVSVKAADELCKKLKQFPLYACDAENKYHSLEWLQYGYLMKKDFDAANLLVKKMSDVAAKDSDLMYQQWHCRMWARQILLSQNWNMNAIKIAPIATPGESLYWAAYTECGALLADSFLAIHHQQPVDAQLKRLDSIIELTGKLTDPYIKQTCEIVKLEIQTEDARVKGLKDQADALLKKALSAQKEQISTELTPSLAFLPAEQYQKEYFNQASKQ
jgi:hypothetical protein